MTSESSPGAEVWKIAAVKARYFRFLDLKEWLGWRSLFTDDARFDHPTIGTFDNIDAAVAATRDHIGERWTAHEAGIPEIRLLSADSAEGIFAMSSHTLVTGATDFRRTWGHYHDAFRFVDGEWKISSMQLRRFSVGTVVVPVQIDGPK